MTILLLETVHTDAHALLATKDEVMLTEAAETALAAAQNGNVQAILTRGKGKITRELMQACGGSLKAVCRCGAGVDTVDVTAAHELGVEVIYAPGINAVTVAEHTLMLMLAITRRAFVLMREVKAGNWAIRNGYEGVELRGKTLGIVGMGNIGREVALRAQVFGMRVLTFSRMSKTTREELLRESDVISLHLPLTDETRGWLGVNEFAQMKRGAFLINTSRGAVVDKAALKAALQEGTLAGFAGDVFDPQPPSQNDMAFVNDDRVILTPHVAGLTDKTYREVCLYCAENLLAVVKGGVPEQKSVFGY
jgi:D-3-phosphoglycerate dehydrogenase / 2-oxoglutarate reductase